VTYAMEHFHDKISAAVFLAAMMLPSGYPLTFDVRFLPPISPVFPLELKSSCVYRVSHGGSHNWFIYLTNGTHTLYET